VAELGHDLFQELKLLEPCGMGNPVPKILIQNCYFRNLWNKKPQDLRGRKIEYIKTNFTIYDDSDASGFPGVWWGHYRDELQENKAYDAVVELDFNTYDKQYEVRLIEVIVQEEYLAELTVTLNSNTVTILDWRSLPNSEKIKDQSILLIEDCPTSWQELKIWCRRAFLEDKKLAIAYSQPPEFNPVEIWEKLVGIAKYISRTHQPITRQQLLHKLNIGDVPLKLGFEGLQQLGFEIKYQNRAFYFDWKEKNNHQPNSHYYSAIQAFVNGVQEEKFMRQYFSRVSVATISAIANHSLVNFSENQKEF
jgi:single-stranded-DNA-specific exonuclease